MKRNVLQKFSGDEGMQFGVLVVNDEQDLGTERDGDRRRMKLPRSDGSSDDQQMLPLCRSRGRRRSRHRPIQESATNAATAERNLCIEPIMHMD